MQEDWILVVDELVEGEQVVERDGRAFLFRGQGERADDAIGEAHHVLEDFGPVVVVELGFADPEREHAVRVELGGEARLGHFRGFWIGQRVEGFEVALEGAQRDPVGGQPERAELGPQLRADLGEGQEGDGLLRETVFVVLEGASGEDGWEEAFGLVRCDGVDAVPDF
jgi:hypothetical protein